MGSDLFELGWVELGWSDEVPMGQCFFFSISVIFLIVCSRKSLIVATKAKFSIMIDESTSVANVKSLILYVGFLFNGEVCTYFLALIPLTKATAAAIEKALQSFSKIEDN